MRQKEKINFEISTSNFNIMTIITIIPLVSVLSLVACNIVGDSVTTSYSTRYGTYHQCSREPMNTNSAKTPGNNGFKIKISGNPEKYVPGEMYTGKRLFPSLYSQLGS